MNFGTGNEPLVHWALVLTLPAWVTLQVVLR